LAPSGGMGSARFILTMRTGAAQIVHGVRTTSVY
jgi:hypothetical protein